jgi:hypothetical protein
MIETMWFRAADSQQVVGRFVDVEVVDVKASEAAQKNMYKTVPALQAKIAGSHDISVQAVKPFNRKELIERFPGAWEHYEAHRVSDAPKEEVPVIKAIKGTPLHTADFIPRERVPMLKELGFSTIEQIRDMSDTVAQGLGRGAITWRKKAKEFLERT